jgi:hypothetical protein
MQACERWLRPPFFLPVRWHAARPTLIRARFLMPIPQRFYIQRADLKQAHIGPDPDATAPLQAGQARLHVESFALTANNITYAAFGELMKYWQFFPAPDAAFGCLPVWGFATIVESQAEGLDVGRRVWGYYPAGTHLVVSPGRVSRGGFVDGAAHRAELAAVYNQYNFCDADPGYKPELEGLQAVLRPLFFTSFLIDDWLADEKFFGAQQVLLSSASSKTAFGTAWCLAQRRSTSGAPAGPKIIGLTSPGNAAYTRSLGCYDQVCLYDQLTGSLDARTPTVYVDFAGSAPLRRAVHGHFDGTLAFSSSIGGTHWDELGGGGGLPGPKPALFFAPAQIKKRSAPPPEGWGPAELQKRLATAWAGFLGAITAGTEPWLEIEYRHGADALRSSYAAVLAGQADARRGLMLSLSSVSA